jgi:hypothetical protein
MPASTPIYGFPYPLGTDPVGQGAQDIQDLATAVESHIDRYSGLVKIIPTSATNGTVDARGNVTIGSAVNLVTINNAFIPQFNAYKVIIRNVNCSSGQNSIWLKLETSLTTYKFQLTYSFYAQTGLTTSGSTGHAAGAWVSWSDSLSRGGNTVVDIINPNLALPTSFTAQMSGHELWGIGHSIMTTATAYTTLYVNSTGVTMTGGSVQIYGYNQ